MENSLFPDRPVYFANILLPVPIPKLFTYRIPRSMEEEITEGTRVIVPFGKRKIITGIIGSIHQEPPVKYEAKSILEILDDRPVMTRTQLRFMQWIASYYMAAIGEVLTAALPSGLKITSESKIQLHPEFDPDEDHERFSDSEFALLTQLQSQGDMTYTEVGEFTGLKNIYHLIHGLMLKDAIIVFDEVKDKYSPRKQRRLLISENYVHALDEALGELSRAPRQEEALLAFLNILPVHDNPSVNKRGVLKKALTDQGIPASAIKALADKGILKEYDQVISRFAPFDGQLKAVTLTPGQVQAKQQILKQFESRQVVLLHGVTGSGKTQVYMDLISDVLENGSQVLYLLPEIALTTQIVNRLREVFGDQLGVYHSKFSDNERVEVWKGVLSGRFQVIAGVRSSIFLPFEDLGLVIIDEEHEHSYKQYDPSPRYHARDAGIMLAGMHQAKVLLGTATPSMESWYLARDEKYGYVTLTERYGEASLPEITIVDMLREQNKKKNKQSFSSVLYEQVREKLENNRQAIVFQNRRGYSPYLQCEQCGWIPQCTNCAVSLTYHQFGESIICHYCGYREPVPGACEACGHTHMVPVGLGTERIEEETSLVFPGARVLRMDLDTTRSKYGYERILQTFEEGEADILVGTQMVSKGLDFDRVSLVGIIDFDRMLHFPNFRSTERAVQLALQVSGRAGRKDLPGTVVIQTRDVNHPVLTFIREHNYQGFYDQEIGERQLHRYPPFTRLISIHLKHRDRETVREAGRVLGIRLRQGLGEQRVLGPQEPVINKVRNEYLNDLIIKLERQGIDLKQVKDAIRTTSMRLQQEKLFRQLKIVFDVDPY